MGEKTAQQLITEGGLLAGRDDQGDRILQILPMWLDSMAQSWPWPVLKKTATSVALGGGATSLTLGRTGVITDRISRVLDNVWVYTSDYKTRGRVRIREAGRGEPYAIFDPATNTGMPTEARVAKTSMGVWTLQPWPIPDKAYVLAIDYIYMPAFGGSGVAVWYENDFTTLNAIRAMVLEEVDGPEQRSTQAAWQEVTSMAANDRLRYGQAPGQNDTLQLDDSVFL